MFNKKSSAAILIAGSLFGAQASAEALLSDEASMLSGAMLSGEELTELTWSDQSDDSSGYQLTVFNPDGSSYTLAAAADWAIPEPTMLLVTDEALPDQITVFEPDGSSHSYQFARVEFLAPEMLYSLYSAGALDTDFVGLSDTHYIVVEVAEPIIVGVADDDVVFGIVELLDDSESSQTAQADVPADDPEFVVG